MSARSASSDCYESLSAPRSVSESELDALMLQIQMKLDAEQAERSAAEAAFKLEKVSRAQRQPRKSSSKSNHFQQPNLPHRTSRSMANVPQSLISHERQDVESMTSESFDSEFSVQDEVISQRMAPGEDDFKLLTSAHTIEQDGVSLMPVTRQHGPADSVQAETPKPVSAPIQPMVIPSSQSRNIGMRPILVSTIDSKLRRPFKPPFVSSQLAKVSIPTHVAKEHVPIPPAPIKRTLEEEDLFEELPDEIFAHVAAMYG